MRLAYLVFYDGTCFRGFVGGPSSVEAHLRRALANLCDLDADEVKIRCASRTDPGVTAIGNVIAVDLPRYVRPEEINSKLPECLRVWGVAEVSADFNPRSAYLRRYVYIKPHEGEDVEITREAARLFIGKHDFSNFQIIDEELSPVTEIYNISVELRGNVLLYVFEGSGFRNKMIRKIVWVLTQVGLGKMSLDTLRKLINVEVRKTVPSAPAEGLVLVEVKYRAEPRFTRSYKAINEITRYVVNRMRVFLALYSALSYVMDVFSEHLLKHVIRK